MLASLAKQGVGRSFSSYTKRQFHMLRCSLKYKSYLQLRIRSKLLRLATKKGTLYYFYLSTRICTCKTMLIDYILALLYLQIQIRKGSFLREVARYLDSLQVYSVSTRVKAFILVLASIDDKTQNLLQNIVHRIKQLSLLTNYLRSISNKLTPLYSLKIKSFPRALLFLNLLRPLAPK